MEKPNYKKGFEILEEFFEYLPEDMKSAIDEKLREWGL